MVVYEAPFFISFAQHTGGDAAPLDRVARRILEGDVVGVGLADEGGVAVDLDRHLVVLKVEAGQSVELGAEVMLQIIGKRPLHPAVLEDRRVGPEQGGSFRHVHALDRVPVGRNDCANLLLFDTLGLDGRGEDGGCSHAREYHSKRHQIPLGLPLAPARRPMVLDTRPIHGPLA